MPNPNPNPNPNYYTNTSNIEDNIQTFVQNQLQLLHIEHSHDENDHETNGILKHLSLIERSVGLYGRTVCTFANASDPNSLLPVHGFSTGEDVEIIVQVHLVTKLGASSNHNSNNNNPNQNNNNSNNNCSSNSRGSKGNVIKLRGCTSKVQQPNSISVVMNQVDDSDGALEAMYEASAEVTIRPLVHAEVRRRMERALNSILEEYQGNGVSASIIRSAFSKEEDVRLECKMTEKEGESSQSYFNGNLDSSQTEAIEFALDGSRPITLLHGPPGTGKTTTVVELIRQAVFRHNYKVLVCAPSNVAVDNILERLVTPILNKSNSTKRISRKEKKKLLQSQRIHGIPKVVRLGHPARLQPSVLKHSLEAMVRVSDGIEVVNECRVELKCWMQILFDKMSKKKASYAEKRIARSEIKQLRREIRSREEKIVRELILSRNVVLSTNIGAATKLLQRKENNHEMFDMVIIDEAAQALEASCWIPALLGRRLVLAGDHRQLPPTIKSSRAKSQLSITMFDRLMRKRSRYDDKDGQSVSRMLSVQYRMNNKICRWSSEEFYNGVLTSAPFVAEHILYDLPHIKPNNEDDLIPIMVLVDTSGCVDALEEVVDSGSRRNNGEAHIIARHLSKLVEFGTKMEDIAVITPYSGQVALLREMLWPIYGRELEIRSVDGFQGGEKEIVLLSLVRSYDNDNHNDNGVGFLKDDRRLNVAVTRARRHLFVACNAEHLSNNDPFLKRFVEYLEEHGIVYSAISYLEDVSSPSLQEDENLLSKTSHYHGLKKSERKKSSRRKDRMAHSNRGYSTKDNVYSSTPKTSKSTDGHLYQKPDELVHNVNIKVDVQNSEDFVGQTDDRSPKSEVVDKNFSSNEDGKVTVKSKSDMANQEPEPPLQQNELLRDLARERMQRLKNREETSSIACTVSHENMETSKTKKKNKKKPKKKKIVTKNSKEDIVDNNHIEDDMAFLDAEIDRVQNSHGRKIDGGGQNYRRIMNGILLPQPKSERALPKNERAAASLRSKLKEAEKGRRTKSTSKKKR